MAPQNRFVCIVDDSKADLFIARKAIEKSGLELDYWIAESVDDAIEQLRHKALTQSIKNVHFLIDLNMPVRNGFELVRFLRSHEVYKDSLVYIFTASNSPVDNENALDNGADKLIVKPSDFNAMCELLKTLFPDQSDSG